MIFEEEEILGNILTDEQRRRSVLIHAFHRIQKENNYLPADKLDFLSKELQIPLSEVYSTASFYKQFYFKPRGRNIICVCVGTACHVRGAQELVNKLEESFKIKAGETTEDRAVTLEKVGCVGCCGLAPVVVINDEIVGNLNPLKIDEVVSSISRGEYEKA
ncbi:MAG: NAD(P)H-dependent oxidoreductase subunit E [Thermodesulfovibrionales bacterium]|nr:NAD(P)H-dependent oxidoreductase subunit E [Thermodesulfovibrionales bacterium]